MKTNTLSNILLIGAFLITSLDSASAAVRRRSVPDVLYENTVLTIKAKPNTKISSNENPLRVCIVTADNQEFTLNTVLNKSNTRAQVSLPILEEGGNNMYRVILKISGGNIKQNQVQGFSRLLLRKSVAEDILLNGDLPPNSDPVLTNAPTIPASVDPGVNIQGSQGEQGPEGPAGPAGPQGATGPQGPAGTLDDGSVTTAKLASEAVTTEKVNSIASSKITGLTPFAKASTVQIFDEEPSDVDNELDLTDINFVKVESLDPNTEIFGVKNAGVEGQRVLILFTGSNCVTVESDDSDATYEIILYEEDDFHFYPNDTLELVSDGTRWYEVSRGLNADP